MYLVIDVFYIDPIVFALCQLNAVTHYAGRIDWFLLISHNSYIDAVHELRTWRPGILPPFIKLCVFSLDLLLDT